MGFILQCGDCAERFDSSEESIKQTCLLINRMADLIEPVTGAVLRITRLAGQFAKPRSMAFEKQGDAELPNYQGDIINGSNFSLSERKPNPQRMVKAYEKAKKTLTFLENEGDFYSSHEALLLPFEQSLTRQEKDIWYDSSAHMLWLGYRTRFSGEAHAEFLRGLFNPIGVKIGPDSQIDDVMTLLDLLNPAHEIGKIVLICRYGVGVIRQKLHVLLRHLKISGHRVLWLCDPMHGNTHRNDRGFKIRRFSDILSESLDFISILRQEGQRPSGIHLELAGDQIKECDFDEITPQFHNTHCDPRLNPEQCLTLAGEIARALRGSSVSVQSLATSHQSSTSI